MVARWAGDSLRRVLVCGSRDWSDPKPIFDALAVECHLHGGRNLLLIHGDARGADRVAASVAHRLGITVHAFPADWKGHGRAAGPIRNKVMLDQRPAVVYAFKDEATFDWTLRRGGTENMVSIAIGAGVPTHVNGRAVSRELLPAAAIPLGPEVAS